MAGEESIGGSGVHDPDEWGEGSCQKKGKFISGARLLRAGTPAVPGGCPRSEEFAGLGRRMGADSRGHEQRVRRAEEGWATSTEH